MNPGSTNTIQERLKRIKEVAEEYSSSTTMHGPLRLYNASSNVVRIFWVIVLLVVVSIASLNIVYLVSKMNRNDVHTKRTSKTNSLMEFPVVKICNMNRFRKSQVKKDLKGVIRHSLYDQDGKDDLMTALVSMNRSQMYQLGHPMENFIVAHFPFCRFNTRPCNVTEYFKSTSNALEGNCFSFNPDGSLKQYHGGNIFGLILTVNVNQSEYDHNTATSTIAGATISIHHPMQENSPFMAKTILSPGHMTRISIQHRRVIRLPDPYPDKCIEMYGKRISNTGCLLECLIAKVIKGCGKVSAFEKAYLQMSKTVSSHLHNVPVGNSAKDLECARRYESILRNGELHCNCSKPCQDDIYAQKMSSARWPSNAHTNYVLDNLKKHWQHGNWTKTTLEENIAVVEIFFDDFTTYEEVQVADYNAHLFISDLGGQLGLWIGASIFSVIELGAFVVKVITNFFHTPQPGKVSGIIHDGVAPS